jgi:hypothetical protein
VGTQHCVSFLVKAMVALDDFRGCVAIAALLSATAAWPCKCAGVLPTTTPSPSLEVLLQSDAPIVVRARVVEVNSERASNDAGWTVDAVTARIEVLQMVRGKVETQTLVLGGTSSCRIDLRQFARDSIWYFAVRPRTRNSRERARTFGPQVPDWDYELGRCGGFAAKAEKKAP